MSKKEDDLRKQVELLTQQIAELSKRVGGGIPTPRYPMWALIRDYLKAHGNAATPLEIANALVEAGHKLGKYPLRNVKITVTSPALHGVFKITENATGEEKVTLLDRSVQYHPKKWENKIPARRARR